MNSKHYFDKFIHGGRLKQQERIAVVEYLLKVAITNPISHNSKSLMLHKVINRLLNILARMTDYSTINDVLHPDINLDERICYDKMIAGKIKLTTAEINQARNFLKRMKIEYKHNIKAVKKAEHLLNLMAGMTQYDTLEDMRSYKDYLKTTTA